MGARMEHVWVGVVDQERMGGEKENVVQIGHPKERVNSLKDGVEHQV